MLTDERCQGGNREELADVEAEWTIAVRLGKLKELKKVSS
ncbi:DUF3292 domain-containing protein [Aeromonas allosaccharophila]|nr:DUF3292 domain-containing protein [Aeromonas allosaccharophila]